MISNNTYTTVRITNPWGNAPVLYRKVTSSTQDDARKLAAGGTPHGTVIMAGYQKKGRGRYPERQWSAEPDKNLLCTIIFSVRCIPFPIMRLPLLIGLAIVLLCERHYGVNLRIKWPNDILYDGKKCAGILCEKEKENILAGVGINCNQAIFHPVLQDRATSLSRIIGRDINIYSFCEHLLFLIKDILDEKEWKPMLENRLSFSGRAVRVTRKQDEGEKKEKAGVAAEGIVSGIDDDGALLILTKPSSQPVRIISGEVTDIQ
jgi:BirA family biotin operon repressor/biotin-[acetyl-CoA-carboxylase] ligase